jgi:hypothetical protein
MAKYLGKLELLEVNEEEFTTTFTFLYAEFGEIREVTWFIGLYDKNTKKWKKDDNQADKYVNNVAEILNSTPAHLQDLIGQSFDVWDGEKFSYLWEPVEISKFDADEAGQIYNATIVAVDEYEAKAVIRVQLGEKMYVSNLNWGKWVQSLNKSLPDPHKKQKQLEKFKKKFHVDFDNRESLIGKNVMIEVEENTFDSTGSNPTYITVKALPKAN